MLPLGIPSCYSSLEVKVSVIFLLEIICKLSDGALSNRKLVINSAGNKWMGRFVTRS